MRDASDVRVRDVSVSGNEALRDRTRRGSAVTLDGTVRAAAG